VTKTERAPIRVLIADDEAAVRDAYRQILTEADMSGETAVFHNLRSRLFARPPGDAPRSIGGNTTFAPVFCEGAEAAVKAVRDAIEMQTHGFVGGVQGQPVAARAVEPYIALVAGQQCRASLHDHAAGQHGQRIQPEVRRYVAHRGQRVALLEHPFQDHGDHPVTQLPVNRQAVIPLRVHDLLVRRL